MRFEKSGVALALLVGVAGSGALRAQGTGDHLGDYNNVRFGYYVGYPKDLVRPQPESDNGDGRVFAPVEGHADIRVWGGWVDEEVGQSLQGRTHDALKECGGKASYQLLKPTFSVLSCVLPSGKVYYIKLMQGKDEVVGLELTYPQSEKGRWDGVAAAMGKSLQILEPPTAM